MATVYRHLRGKIPTSMHLISLIEGYRKQIPMVIIRLRINHQNMVIFVKFRAGNEIK